MKTTTIWALLLAGLATVAVSGFAGAVAGIGSYGLDSFNSSPIDSYGLSQCSGTSVGEDLSLVQQIDESIAEERRVDQTVDIDDDTVLLGIALANNGAHDIDFNTLRDFTLTRTEAASQVRVADLRRDDVFSALALGFDARGGSLDTLACVSDVSRETSISETLSQTVNLDENNVLLAIALSNSVGGPLRFSDVADISQVERIESERIQAVDVDREDAFLALALGAGGRV